MVANSPAPHSLMMLLLPSPATAGHPLLQGGVPSSWWPTPCPLLHTRCTLLPRLLQVTPSSKVVGDLAQFMVANNLDEHSLVEQAETLSLPSRWVAAQLSAFCHVKSSMVWLAVSGGAGGEMLSLPSRRVPCPALCDAAGHSLLEQAEALAVPAQHGVNC